MNISFVRNLAYSKIKKLPKPNTDNPIEALKNLDWSVPNNEVSVDQDELVRLNLELDPNYCFGRLAAAAAFVELWFPKAKLQFGEVLEDVLRNIMLDDLALPIVESELKELLMYEDPHAVLVIDGMQFDPVLVKLDLDIRHPKLGLHPIWEGLTVTWLTQKARMANSLDETMGMLRQAEALCPGTSIVTSYFAELEAKHGTNERAIELLAKANELRLTARGLFVAAALGDEDSFKKFHQIYHPALFRILAEEVIPNGAAG
jgi:hypothetical protein